MTSPTSSLVLRESTIFAGRYRVLRCVAIGGMGAVYEVVHVETERRLALKVMLPGLIESRELRDRFRQEARIAAHIESEHIVTIFDAGFDRETMMPYLIMEFLRGEELGRRLTRLGRFTPTDVVQYLGQTNIFAFAAQAVQGPKESATVQARQMEGRW